MNNPFPRKAASSTNDPAGVSLPDIDLEISGEASPPSPPTAVAAAVQTQTGSPVATELILLLDPAAIEVPTTPNRRPEAFESDEFSEFKVTIIASGGNLQPIRVRQIEFNPARYRLIYGARRLHACALANLPVRAIVAAPGTEDKDCLDHLRENLGRADLSPYEFGDQVKNAMEAMAPITLTALASKLGVSTAMLSRAYDIAKLPGIIISAFPSPSDIRYQDVKPLKDAWKADPDAVGLEVATIVSEDERPDGPNVVRRITQAVKNQQEDDLAPCKTPEASRRPTAIQCRGQDVGRWQVLPTGAISIEISAPMSDYQREVIVATMVQHLERRVLKPRPVTPEAEQASVVAAGKEAA